MKIYQILRKNLLEQITKNNLHDKKVKITCRALTAFEAIGNPEHQDYPIIKGKEKMVEADFLGAKGQAFADNFENAEYTLSELLAVELDSNKKRASFIATFNAVYRYLDLSSKTIHCKDKEPVECADNLKLPFKADDKILMVGLQPRLLEALTKQYQNIRILDLDEDNIGKEKSGVVIESGDSFNNALEWCSAIFATGSTIVNDSIHNFLTDKPVVFYGVTISAAAEVFGFQTFCHCGR